jgi:hypothetical protein
VLATIERYKDRVITHAIKPRTRWKPLAEPPVLARDKDPGAFPAG